MVDNEKIKIDVYLAGTGKVIKSMQNIQKYANEIRQPIKTTVEIVTKQAQQSIKNLEREILNLTKRRNDIKDWMESGRFNNGVWGLDKDFERLGKEIRNRKSDIKALKTEMKSLGSEGTPHIFSNKFWQSVYSTKGGTIQALRQVKELANSVGSISKREYSIRFRVVADAVKSQLNNIRSQISKLEREKMGLKTQIDLGNGNTSALKDRLKEVELELKELKYDAKELEGEYRRLGNTDITPRLDWGLFTKVSSVVRNIGSSMLSLSGAIGRITAPLDMLTRGTLYTAAFTGLNKITEGLSGSFERYDIMHTYPKIMESMGSSTAEANKAIYELYQSVLGLPTGLDTIVEAQKQYYLATGDMTKATKMAIAANNAFVAGGADDVQILQGQRQLRDLMSAGKLKISEWESLAKAMPSAFKAIQDDLHVSRSQIFSNLVSPEKFVGSLLKVATGKGKVAQAAEEMKHTFTAVGANIRNSLRDAGVKTLETLDETLKKYDGGDVIDHLLEIKPAIQEMRDAVTEWIKANPDKILEFLDKLKAIDIMGVIRGGAQAFSTVGKFLMNILNMFGGGGEKFGKFFIYLHFFGKALGAVGGLVKGSAPLWGFMAMMGRFFKTTQTWTKLAKVNAVEKVIEFLNRFKKVEKGVKAVEGAETAAAGAAGATASFSTLFANLLAAVTPAIAIGVYAGAFALVGKALASLAKSFKIVGNTDVPFFKAAGNIAQITGLLTEFGLLLDATAGLHIASGGVKTVLDIVGGGVMLGMAKLLQELAKTMNILNDVKIPTDTKLSDIENGIEDIMSLYEKIDTGNFGEAISRAARSWADNKHIKHIQEMTETIVSLLDNVNAMINKIEGVSKTKGLSENTEKAKTVFSTVSTFIEDFYGMAEGLFNADFGSEDRTGGSVGGDRKRSIKNATKKLKQLTDYVKQLDSLMLGMATLPQHFKNIKDTVDKLKKTFPNGNKQNPADSDIDTSAITNNIKTVVGIIDSIVNEGELTKLEDAISKLKGVKIDALKTELDKIPTLFESLQTLKDYFYKANTDWMQPADTLNKYAHVGTNALGGGGKQLIKTDSYNIYKQGGEANNLLESIKNIVQMVNNIASEFEGVQDIKSKADAFKNGVTALTNAYTKFIEFRDYTVEHPAKSGEAKKTISTVIADLISAMSDASTLYLNASFLNSAAKDISGAFKLLTTSKTGSVSTFVSYLNKIPKALSAVNTAMKGRGTAWKNQLVSGFKTSAQDILTQIQNISLALAGNTYYANFYQAGANAGASYSNGFNNSINLNTPNGTTTTTTTTKAQKLFSRVNGGVSGWAKKLFGSTGGYITKDGILYRANGGEVFQPRGTDRIPAMLSEGEYVMQRRATSAFGTKFMQRINNLDLGGAIKALGMRGGQLAYATPTVNIDNSKHVTYNNNQSVNMTNNHASQGYSEARASRYLRKM